jgi:hypothetical protein
MYYELRAVVAAVFVAAAFFSILRARADAAFRASTPESVARAVELAPSNGEYLLFRALQIDYDGGDATGLLERAAALNPTSSAPRIRLGLAAEIRGDNASAEQWLLDAARIDKQFEPRWTLANFCFRNGNAAQFWIWLTAALDRSYGDRRPAFELAWRESDDAERISRAIPGKHEVLAAYLSYLFESHRVDAAAPVALQLASLHDSSDQPLLLGADDEFIAADRAQPALDLWRALVSKYDGIVSGSFDPPRLGHGFDWRTPEIEGVVELDLDHPSRRRIQFDARQPEACELLRQYLSVTPGLRYQLRWQSSLNNLRSPTGIEWRIAGASAPVEAGELAFTAQSRLAPLTLNYRRPKGEPRAEGSLEVWSVNVAPGS